MSFFASNGGVLAKNASFLLSFISHATRLARTSCFSLSPLLVITQRVLIDLKSLLPLAVSWPVASQTTLLTYEK